MRDFLDKPHFEQLVRSKGIANDTAVVFYGDKNNWWACYAFWVFKLFGHEKCLLMNGGRKRWELDGNSLGARPRAELSDHRLSRPRIPTSRSGLSEMKCSNINGPASRWSMCVRRANSPASCPHARLSARGGAPAAAIFRVR